MLLFRCKFNEGELASLKNYLPAKEYCLVGGPGEDEYYGVMGEGLHDKLMDILSGETLEMLEYIDDSEIREVLKSNRPTEKIGNHLLLESYQ
ncbi:MAG: hypothetical protein JNK79_20460 [Chitinophagaceae bacterium]|nr:hypothetical protein [Chitinophagaceae bacterium]